MNNIQSPLAPGGNNGATGATAQSHPRPIENIKAALEEYEVETNEVAASGAKAVRMLNSIKGIFERWDDRSHEDFVAYMQSEVIPFLNSRQINVFSH